MNFDCGNLVVLKDGRKVRVGAVGYDYFITCGESNVVYNVDVVEVVDERPRCEECGEVIDGAYGVDTDGLLYHTYCNDDVVTIYEKCEGCGGYHDSGLFECVDDTVLCPRCVDNETRECAECGELHLIANLQSIYYADAGTLFFCEDCLINIEDYSCPTCDRLYWREPSLNRHDECQCCEDNDRDRTMHDYSYKPRAIFLGESADGRFFGTELEVDGDGDWDVTGAIDENYSPDVYLKEDGSLNDGFEIVTHPMSFDYASSFDWKDIMRRVRDAGFRSHDAETCGLHIHVSRDAFGETIDEQDMRIGKVLHFFNKFQHFITKFSRRTVSQIDSWASFYPTRALTEDGLKEETKVLKGEGRYFAVNVQPRNTVEFRIFRGTLKVNTYLATLQFVNKLCDLVIDKTLTELDAMTIEEIKAEYFTDTELKKYMEERGI